MPDIRSLCPYRLLSYDMPPATLHRGCLASPPLFMFKRTAQSSIFQDLDGQGCWGVYLYRYPPAPLLNSTSLRTLEHGFGRMNGIHTLLSISRSDGHTSLRNFTLHRCRQPPTSTTVYCRGVSLHFRFRYRQEFPDVHPMTRRHTVLPPTGKALILLPSELQYLPLYILINGMYEWKLRDKAIRNYRLTARQRAGQALLIA